MLSKNCPIISENVPVNLVAQRSSMSNTLKVIRAVSVYRQFVLAKVMSWKSWSYPYRTDLTGILTTSTGSLIVDNHSAWKNAEGWKQIKLQTLTSKTRVQTRFNYACEQNKSPRAQCILRSHKRLQTSEKFSKTPVQKGKLRSKYT